MNVLRPNIKQDDQKHADDSSDDEVPQDFLIETAAPPGARKPSSPSTPRAAAYKGKERVLARQRPLYNTSNKPSPPILPSTAQVSVPPRPSELEPEAVTTASEPLKEQRPKQMRGLDAYERALWNWVNVYNLDAFLQEAYYYYEGKGIYSIALSRGLNLLWVVSLMSCKLDGALDTYSQDSRLRHWLLDVPFGMHRLFAHKARESHPII